MKSKAKIKKVGTIDKGRPTGWVFEREGNVKIVEIKDGKILYSGYTVDELFFRVVLSQSKLVTGIEPRGLTIDELTIDK